MIFCGVIYWIYRPKVKRQMAADKTKKIESYKRILKILLLTITPVIFSTAIYNCSAIIDSTLFSMIMVDKGMAAKIGCNFVWNFFESIQRTN